MSVPVVETEGLTKQYGVRTAIDKITMQIAPGELLVVLGNNGSGKSTLLQMLATALSPDQGRIAWFGSDDPFQARKRMGVVFDHSSHWDSLTGRENAYFFARSYGLDRGEACRRLDELFAWIGLEDRADQGVSTYSLGMRRKLAILEALVHRPQLMLLDEPSIGLDYLSKLAVEALLRDLAEHGTTVIVTTNDVHEASALAKRVALLHQGKMVALSTPDALARLVDASTKVRVRLAAPLAPSALAGIEGVGRQWVEDASEDLVAVFLLDPSGGGVERTLSRILDRLAEHDGNVVDIEVRRPDLGDVMLSLSEVEKGASRQPL